MKTERIEHKGRYWDVRVEEVKQDFADGLCEHVICTRDCSECIVKIVLDKYSVSEIIDYFDYDIEDYATDVTDEHLKELETGE